MIVAESRRGRRLVGRLDRGSDVLEALLEVCRAHQVRTAELRALGALEQAVVNEFDQRGRQFRAARRFDAQFEIVHLNGNVSEKDGKLFAQAHVALSRERDNGIELVGGRLVSGRVYAVEFVIDVFDDLVLRRVADPSTGLLLWREAIKIGEPAAPPSAHAAPQISSAATVNDDDGPAHLPFEAPARALATTTHIEPAPTWQEVAQASALATAPVEPAAADGDATPAADEDARPSPGDWIDHPKFGRCQVERIEGDYEFVSARLRNQRLIRLSLDVLTLIPAGREGDHLLFRAVPGR